MEIKNVKVIEHFTNKNTGKVYGIYSAEINGALKVFVNNEGDFGVICNWQGESVTKCIARIRNTVKENLLVRISDIV